MRAAISGCRSSHWPTTNTAIGTRSRATSSRSRATSAGSPEPWKVSATWRPSRGPWNTTRAGPAAGGTVELGAREARGIVLAGVAGRLPAAAPRSCCCGWPRQAATAAARPAPAKARKARREASDHRFGAHAEHHADEQAPEGRLPRQAPAGWQELADDVQDRPGGQGKAADVDEQGVERGADERAEEGRPTADEAGERQPAPGAAHARGGQRPDDAEALGRVVEPEPDDQQGGQRDLAAVGRLADGQALREVVQADARRDRHAGPQRGGPGGELGRRLGGRHRPRPDAGTGLATASPHPPEVE